MSPVAEQRSTPEPLRRRGRRARPSPAPRQLALPLPATWGGARPGAGRPPSAGRRAVPHRARLPHRAAHPVHVTLRSAVRPLRSPHVFPSVRAALAAATRRAPDRFRILQFSVQLDHIHLLVEAGDARALSSGVRGIAIRVARAVNRLLRRSGRFWADRWHGRDLTSPRQVRHALCYVLQNFRKHARRALPPGVDRFSSGAFFDGWRGVSRQKRDAWARPPPVAAPRTWLARVGWRRRGLIGLGEGPREGPAPARGSPAARQPA